jgi:uncharacterized protein (DUF1330 family)
MRIVPAVEGHLGHVIVLENFLQPLGDILVRDRCAGRCLEKPLLGPQIIGRMVARRLLCQPLSGQPEERADMPDAGVRCAMSEDQGRQVGSLAQIEASKNTSSGDVERLAAASCPDGTGEERGRRFDALVEDQIAVLVFPRRHPAGVAGHAQDLLGVEKRPERRISGPDRCLRERIKLGRRRIELDHRRRVVTAQGVVDKDAKQVAVGGRLRADDAQRGFLRPDRSLKGLVQRRAWPWTRPSSSWMIRFGDRPKAVATNLGGSYGQRILDHFLSLNFYPAVLAAYAKLSGPTIVSNGGQCFLARGGTVKTYEQGIAQRTIVAEFDSVEQAIAAHDSPRLSSGTRRARQYV